MAACGCCPLLVAGLLAAQAEPSRPSFAEFLAGIKTEALARGIRPEIVDSALAGIEEPSAVVIERDRSQAEVVQTLEQYLSQRVTAQAVATGREMLDAVPRSARRDRGDLQRPADAHRRRSGASNRTSAASPACARRWPRSRRWPGIRGAPRSSAGSCSTRSKSSTAATSISPDMKGSWAGAMGQTQFMPSSYLRFARGLRRRRPPRHLVDAGGRLRVDRELHARQRLDQRRSLGPRSRRRPPTRAAASRTRSSGATARARRGAT